MSFGLSHRFCDPRTSVPACLAIRPRPDPPPLPVHYPQLNRQYRAVFVWRQVGNLPRKKEQDSEYVTDSSQKCRIVSDRYLKADWVNR